MNRTVGGNGPASPRVPRAALRCATLVAALAVACGTPDPQPRSLPQGPTMVPAPYVKPAVGTKLVYDSFTNVVTKADQWHVEFRDERGNLGARVGGFIPDNPKVPLALDLNLLTQLWPLRQGNSVDIEAQRFPLIWRWHITVVGTARIQTRAGTFDCFVVDATETPTVSTSYRPYTDATRFWYSPVINQVVRIEAERIGGPGVGAHRAAELIRFEEPGRVR